MTKIEWTHIPGYRGKTWNPVTGCTPVSPGCDHCYAKTMVQRFPNLHGWDTFEGEGQPSRFGHVQRHYERLLAPMKWKKPCAIFVCSLGDLFHKSAYEFLHHVFAIMAQSPQHLFLLLTKRPENALNLMADPEVQDKIDDAARRLGMCHANLASRWPLPNVWIGTTAENQEMADKRIPVLLQIPAAKRFVSCEPLLGPVNLALASFTGAGSFSAMEGISWIIAGGESGPGARPMHPNWARSLRDQCQAASVPYFFKQHGEWVSEDHPAWNSKLKQSEAFVEYVLDKSGDPIDYRGVYMGRCGKRAAGCLLDGEGWKQFPETSREKKTA